jgi:hypothetical protein
MDVQIRSIDDLRMEITRLKGVEQEQAIAIRAHFSSTRAIFSTVLSLFPKFSLSDKIGGIAASGGPDLIQLISSFVLPFTLNRTLFKRSNFIIKALVRLASQRAAQFINKKNLGFVWDKIKSFIPEKEKKTGPAYTSLSHIE